uniref:C2H2-type domain-containing protein n=1 Tax=Timema bartmani TaxID=61472 RepID=A0A7R9HY05_9NEOP|nr:unnamed protein product [Timema bartmani]
MPTPTSGAPLVEQQEGSSRRKRKRKREDDDDHHHEDDDMSPEEEASASPPAAVIAGGREDDDQRRMSSPPSGSKFLHDEVLPITRITEDGVDDRQALTNLRLHKHRDEEEDAASSGCSDDETTSRHHQSGSKVKTKEGSRDIERPRNFVPVVEDSLGTSSDVEKFDGKIVYNPDGSAYIIEDSEMSEEDTGLEVLPRIIGDGCIVDGRGVSLPHLQSFPQIANAFYVSRNPSLYNALYGGTASYSNNLLQDKKIVPEVPIMHSYRVYTVRDSKSGDSEDGKMYDAAGRGDCDGRKPEISEKKVKSDKFSGKDCSSVPVKPILMCFICKLSFGYAKSFVAHAMGDHNVALLEDEKDILGHKNASAIIQCVGKDKEPLVSFLEPLSPGVSTLGDAGKRVVNPVVPPLSEADMNNLMAAAGITSTAVSQLVPKDQQVSYAVGGGGDECAGADKKAVDSIEPESLVVHRRHTLDCGTGSGIAPMGRPNVQNIHVPETSVSLPQNCGSSSNSSNNHNNCNSNSRMIGIGMNSVMDLTRKSPISASAASSGNNGRGSVSPGASPSPGSTLSPLLTGVGPTGPLQYPQPPPNFLTGTTIGVCPDHMGGRPSGVECAKCELILNSSRLGGGGVLAGMHSRNSCKTLKCPKCNWHYKYQETLEIHMKEKHPEAETSCIYCIAGQPHPRLARGETYTCGYKPYRCEVCNYSTTTKGNLSIHMQSDKHLNNMQELQNGGGTMPPTSEPSGISGPPPSTQPPHHGKSPGPGVGMMSPGGASHPQHSHHQMVQSQKPKPTFRCDVCNYETNVARNLRIHMTSEKHTHNMMVLQQNVKHMQTLSALHQQSQQHQQHQHQQQLSFESLLHFHPGLTLPGDKPPPHTEAALADMAYNQALLIQMMTGGQLPPHIPPELAPHMDMGLNPETMEPPPEPADPNPQHLFQCCVCNIFSTDSLEALSHHLSADRTKTREQEILAVVAGHYVCRLCTYKTNLKANFQLHCKTDKHLQRLQHVNHVKEGGPRNEWKLKYVSSSSAAGGIQVRCHACDYYTNSAHKLQLHAAGQRHEASCLLFLHLRDCESSLGGSGSSGDRVYHCALCGFSSRAKLQLLQHVRSMKHLQMEQLHQLQRRSEGKDLHTDIGEVFQVIGQEHAFSDMTDPGMCATLVL